MKNYSTMGVGILMALVSAARADVITVENTEDITITLSDLIVWAEDGTQEIILKPGFGAAESADDVDLKQHDSRVFTTTKKVKKYFLSYKGKGLFANSEYEWKAGRDVSVIGATASLRTVGNLGQALNCSVELGAAAPPPVPGQFITFDFGITPELPGWFVGTTPDFAGGEILNPFSGVAEVVPGSLKACVLHTCATDLNGDLQVDGADVGLLLLDYGGDATQSDLNGDGEVDGGDLGLMLLDFGDCCSSCEECLTLYPMD